MPWRAQIVPPRGFSQPARRLIAERASTPGSMTADDAVPLLVRGLPGMVSTGKDKPEPIADPGHRADHRPRLWSQPMDYDEGAIHC